MKFKMFDLRLYFAVGSGTAADAEPFHARDAAAKPRIPAGEYLTTQVPGTYLATWMYLLRFSGTHLDTSK